MLKELLSF